MNSFVNIIQKFYLEFMSTIPNRAIQFFMTFVNWGMEGRK